MCALPCGQEARGSPCIDLADHPRSCVEPCRLRRYCADTVVWSVRITTAFAWLTSMMVVAVVPLDVYSTLKHEKPAALGVMWNIAFWCAPVPRTR